MPRVVRQENWRHHIRIYATFVFGYENDCEESFDETVRFAIDQSFYIAAFTHLTRGLDYVLYGHMHRPTEARVAHVRMINPCALERVRPYTVATLDLASDALKFWQVDESAAPTSAPRPFTPR